MTSVLCLVLSVILVILSVTQRLVLLQWYVNMCTLLAHAHAHACTHTHTHARTHAHAHAHTHTHTHTHTQLLVPLQESIHVPDPVISLSIQPESSVVELKHVISHVTLSHSNRMILKNFLKASTDFRKKTLPLRYTMKKRAKR